MDVFDDIFRLTSYNSNPLIPYIKKENNNYIIYYLFVSFADEIEDGKMNISNVSIIGIRNGDVLNYKIINKDFNKIISIEFGIEKLELYQDKSEEYCLLINEGEYEKAVSLYNEIVPNSFSKLYENVIRSIYE